MALHNYIYKKHQVDSAVDGKIAREHDPRPVCVKIYNHDENDDEYIKQSHFNNNKDNQLYKSDNHDNNCMIHDTDNYIINHTSSHNHNLIELHRQQTFSAELKTSYEEEIKLEGLNDEDDSSDNNNLKKIYNEHINSHNHHNHVHHHNQHNVQDHQKLEIQAHQSTQHENSLNISSSIGKTVNIKSQQKMEKVAFKDQKWVIIDGKKRKLKSRFSGKQ
jgi:hypothetical protein